MEPILCNVEDFIRNPYSFAAPRKPENLAFLREFLSAIDNGYAVRTLPTDFEQFAKEDPLLFTSAIQEFLSHAGVKSSIYYFDTPTLPTYAVIAEVNNNRLFFDLSMLHFNPDLGVPLLDALDDGDLLSQYNSAMSDYYDQFDIEELVYEIDGQHHSAISGEEKHPTDFLDDYLVGVGYGYFKHLYVNWLGANA
ncbi:hypothetical protein ACP3V5_17705 [Vibrio maritimus]